MEDARLHHAPQRRPNPVVALVLGVVLVVLIVFGIDYLTIGRPAAEALNTDPRNAGFKFSVHREYRVVPGVLVIDLQKATDVAPVDLMRGLFITAATLQKRGAAFDNVVLSRHGTEVFTLSGPEFTSIGKAYEAGENPVYLIRTLPEKLRTPDGEPAFGSWTGGLLGVVGQQMGDVSTAMNRWAGLAE
ncbi:hypothetical protein [Longimicrobium terrae]|uniref:Uncharacterized protein n=1 Tax=Longimicrobium terrae TaxID=1639882 RepID=A0A841GZ41_9BACT|nr:hypothetical protein [Longimicrobium terrae]MBB4636498.1 hypothetical protein [Longimicrobium terrae]MBB6070978.1 hypothetical protein [Longimicrobium terrae]NNC29000.1 hypothetical protein [Longimicrobium terrae]